MLKRGIVAACIVVLAVASAHAQQETIYTPGDGVSLPTVTKQVGPQYTSEAMSNRIEGKVGLSAVVLANGKVGDVKVIRSLDSVYGLDEAAVKAMKQWEFKPGTKDGKAVAVRVEIDMAFTLK
jgi:TonB family protein